jgi:hypothetical protein
LVQIKEKKKTKLEREIERKEYAESMRQKYYYSKTIAAPSPHLGGSVGGAAINLRALLQKNASRGAGQGGEER